MGIDFNRKNNLVVKKGYFMKGNKRPITVTLMPETIDELDKIRNAVGYSRNELITKLIEFGIEQIVVKK